MNKILLIFISVLLISSCSVNILEEGVNLNDSKGGEMKIGEEGVKIKDDKGNNIDIGSNGLEIEVNEDIEDAIMAGTMKGLEEAFSESEVKFDDKTESEQIKSLNNIINDKDTFSSLPLIEQKIIIAGKDLLVALQDENYELYSNAYRKSFTYTILSLKQKQSDIYDTYYMFEEKDLSYEDFSNLLDDYYNEMKVSSNALKNDKINNENLFLVHSYIEGLTGGLDLFDYIFKKKSSVTWEENFKMATFIKDETLELKNDNIKLIEYINSELF